MSTGFPKSKGLNANICDVSVQLARLEKAFFLFFLSKVQPKIELFVLFPHY